MAAQLRPEHCSHPIEALSLRPLTVEQAPARPGQHSVGQFLRQVARCRDCGQWMVHVTEIVAFKPWRPRVGVVRGVDPR